MRTRDRCGFSSRLGWAQEGTGARLALRGAALGVAREGALLAALAAQPGPRGPLVQPARTPREPGCITLKKRAGRAAQSISVPGPQMRMGEGYPQHISASQDRHSGVRLLAPPLTEVGTL